MHGKSLERKRIRIDALYGIRVLLYTHLVPHQKIHDNYDLLIRTMSEIVRVNGYTMLL